MLFALYGENQKMIFFDNASTTKVFDEVAEAVKEVSLQYYFNPSALYRQGMSAHKIMDNARKVVASKMGAESEELYFTGSATEANNWVLTRGFKNKKGNLVISGGEHASVFECAQSLKSVGYDLRIAGLNTDGTVNIDNLLQQIDETTSLVSIIHCSNETGAINDLAEIATRIKTKNKTALIHSDGVQAFCKIDVDVRALGVDFYTVSAHKIGGPKGIGALYISKKRNVAPFIVGGGQESGLRSGTENTPGMAGFAAAVSAFEKYCDKKQTRRVFDFLRNGLMENGWVYNGAEDNSGFILSLSNPKIKSEILMRRLADEGVLIGLGSACSKKLSQNRILNWLGRTKAEIEGNIRLSFSVFSTLEEAQKALELLTKYSR